MAKMKYWNGTTWETLDAKDADTLDGKHYSDIKNEIEIKYAIASGTNNYTVTIPGITALTEGMSVKVKFTSANTGACTLNINGLGAKEIRKSNGNSLSAGNIKAGQILHLVYTGSVFQLLGEGGEYGTAQPEHVLEGYTIGTEEGIKSGTMTNQGRKIITPSTVNIAIPRGFHDGTGYVKGDSNLKASNIKEGVSIFGVLGTLKDGTNMKNVAFGKQTSGTDLTVNNLTFTPKFILIHKISTNNPPRGYWDIAVYSDGNSPFANQNIRYTTSDFPIVKGSNYNEWYDNATVTQYFSGSMVIQVTSNGFTISEVYGTSAYPVYWVAIG